ncbi:Homeobox protein cut-like 1, partial [Frankliniella fusca]
FGNTSLSRPASSWTSTPDLGNLNDDNLTTTVSITLPRRRPAPPDTGQSKEKEKEEDNFRSTSFTVRRRTASPSLPGPTRKSSWASSSYNSTNDTNNNIESRNAKEETSSTSISNQTLSGSGGLRSRPPPAPSTASSASKPTKDLSSKTSTRTKTTGIKADQKDAVTSPDVQFILQVKGSKATKAKSKVKTTQSSTSTVNNAHSSSSGEESLNEDDDDISIAGTETTETTETTLVDRHDSELQDQIESLKQELETVKARCERVEREKSDILLRRLAAMDTGPSKTAASEVLKLQQKVNEYQTRTEDLLDEKKTLGLRVKELEEELSNRPPPGANQRAMDELRSKLLAAETLCEELMDENEDMKRELRDLEEEMEEMQDNFREDQADEYTSLKKELEQTAKNCRILSFKLRKSERKLEALENEKSEFEKKLHELTMVQADLILRVPVIAKTIGCNASGSKPSLLDGDKLTTKHSFLRSVLGVGEDMTEKANRIRHLEQELAVSNEVSARLQRELDDANKKLKAREDSKDEPKRKAPMLGSLPKKVSRETLTRGGSQDDPAQLLRDLQDSVEREADLREQLKFAEEEIFKLQIKYKPRMSKHVMAKARSQHEKLEEGNDPAFYQLPAQSQPILQSLSTQTDPELESPMSMWDTCDDLTENQPTMSVAADVFMLSVSKHTPGLAPAIRALLDSLLIFLSNLPSSLLCDDDMEFFDVIEPIYVPHDLLTLLKVFFVIEDVLASRRQVETAEASIECQLGCTINNAETADVATETEPNITIHCATTAEAATQYELEDSWFDKRETVTESELDHSRKFASNSNVAENPPIFLANGKVVMDDYTCPDDLSTRQVIELKSLPEKEESVCDFALHSENIGVVSQGQIENENAITSNTNFSNISSASSSTQTEISLPDALHDFTLNEIFNVHQTSCVKKDAFTQADSLVEQIIPPNTNGKRICVVAPLQDSADCLPESGGCVMSETSTQTELPTMAMGCDVDITSCRSPDSLEVERKISSLLDSLNSIAESLAHENLTESQSLEANSLLLQMESSIPCLESLFSSTASQNFFSSPMNITAPIVDFDLGSYQNGADEDGVSADVNSWGPPALLGLNGVDATCSETSEAEEDVVLSEDIASPPLSIDEGSALAVWSAKPSEQKLNDGKHADTLQTVDSGQSLSNVWAVSPCQQNGSETSLSLPIYSLASWWRMQLSLGWVFPPGTLFSSSSPMAALLTPLGNHSHPQAFVGTAQILRKKVSRVEDDNESLVLQLKKMATKARTRRHSPTPNRLTPEPPVEKDEGISDEEDPAELRLLLELNEQEAAVLRRKVEELESEGDKLKRKVKELQDKLTAKNSRKGSVSSLASLNENSSSSGVSSLHEKKIKVLEEETSELRKKLIEKEREAERLSAELSVSQKKGKGTLAKTKSLEGPTEQAIDLKRQLQVIENEAMVLRQRTQTLEAENDKLNSENKRLQLTRNAKNARDSSSSAAELRVLKDKVTSLEAELSSANQKVRDLEGEIIKQGSKKASLKNDELDKMKVQITKITKENEKLSETLKRLKDDAAANLSEFYKARAPKKPTDTTTKLQMKKMVEELESEIGEMIVALRISEENKTKFKGLDALKELQEAKNKVDNELAEIRKKLDEKEKELEGSKAAAAEAKKKLEEELLRSSKDIKKKEEERNKLEKEKDRVKEENEKLKKEKRDVEDQISKLLSEKKAANSSAQGEMSALAQRLEAVTRLYEEEKKEAIALKKQLDVAQRAEQEKIKLQKETAEKSKQLAEIELKLKESEEKLKKYEGLLNTRKEKVSKLEKELESERKVATDSSNKLKAQTEELKEARGKLQTAEVALEDTKKQLAVKTVLMEQLEANLKEERERATDATVKAGSAVAREVSALREELAESKANLQTLKEELEEAEKAKKTSEERLKVIENQLLKEKREIEQRVTDLEIELQTEKKKFERSHLNSEKELKSKETELNTLRSKVKTLESNTSPAKVTESLQQQILALQQQLSAEKQEYEDLTAKYEILEEEHVVTKSQLVTDKQSLERQLEAMDSELRAVQSQLRTLQDTYTAKQDAWIKEKLNMEEQMKEVTEKYKRGNGDTWQLERQKLMAVCDEKSSELEQLKREGQGLRDQVDLMRRESEDLRRKLDDYEKVAEVQRRMTADFNEKENQLKELKNKLLQEEKARKTEVGQLKMRYDSRVSTITEELTSLQSQVTRFKRERDTFRHMLDGAQKTISELRSNPGASKRLSSISSAEESEEARTKIATLEQQVACLEDELSESRLVASKLKTELVSERSAWEVKISEMQSKVNELEEDRLVASGRTKIPGMKTRMELAWHKEREEQTRLLQETSTLARDLRQTLFEVERERDKERLEAKRRLDQIKKTTEEEQEENRKKVMELQCDLLELRDAHAKLRTTNEKLRREKERWDRERDDLRQLASARRRADNDEDRKIQLLLDQVEELMRLSPDVFSQRRGSSQAIGTPTPPVRLKGPKSRESSPLIERKDYSREHSQSRDDSKGNMQSTLQRLIEVTEELRRYQRADSQDRERERARRILGLRRAASTESDTAAEVPAETRSKPSLGRGGAGLQRKGSLMRKTLSLEQTSNAQDQNFWKGDEEDGSVNSLQSLDDDPRLAINRRDNSMDSRLSGGSTQSEVYHSGEKKKKKGLLGKLTKRLTKSRSVDENDPRDLSLESLHNKDGSDASLNTSEDPKGSKRDLKERLTGMFKKGSSSRSNSFEGRQPPGLPLPPQSRSSTLERNAKPPTADSKQRTLARASPSGSDTGQTSSMSRPLAAKKSGVSGASSTSSKKSNH